MRTSSERRGFSDLIPGHALVGLPTVAKFLDVGRDVVNQLIETGQLRVVMVGKRQKVDPVTLAVFVMAREQGMAPDQYWARHGESTMDHARRYFARLRRLQVA